MVGLTELYRLRHFELAVRLKELLAKEGVDLPTRGVRPAGSVAEGTLVSVTTQGGIPCRATRQKRARLRPDLQSPSRFRRVDMVRAMGLPEDCRMTMRQVGEAVPPRYAEVVGRLAMRGCPAHGTGECDGWPDCPEWAPGWLSDPASPARLAWFRACSP